MTIIHGYGLYFNRLADSYLKDEYTDFDVFDFDDILDFSIISPASIDSNQYLYISDNAPYVEPFFHSIDEINNYFYEKLKPILKKNITFKQICNMLTDISDCRECEEF